MAVVVLYHLAKVKDEAKNYNSNSTRYNDIFN